MSWAEECAERWKDVVGHSAKVNAIDVIEMAIREALEKAAEIADDAELWDSPSGGPIAKAIRALGAK